MGREVGRVGLGVGRGEGLGVGDEVRVAGGGLAEELRDVG